MLAPVRVNLLGQLASRRDDGASVPPRYQLAVELDRAAFNAALIELRKYLNNMHLLKLAVQRRRVRVEKVIFRV